PPGTRGRSTGRTVPGPAAQPAARPRRPPGCRPDPAASGGPTWPSPAPARPAPPPSAGVGVAPEIDLEDAEAPQEMYGGEGQEDDADGQLAVGGQAGAAGPDEGQDAEDQHGRGDHQAAVVVPVAV